jgi:hypothetical protein
MLGFRAVGCQTRQIEVIENAERDQRRDALTVRRQFVDGVAAIILRDRIDPLRLVSGQVGRGHHAAFGLRVTLDGFRNLATIQRRAARLGDLPQRLGGSGKGEAFADFRRPALGQEGFLEAGLLDQRLDAESADPLVLDRGGHEIAALGDLDGRLQQVGERQLAEALG